MEKSLLEEAKTYLAGLSDSVRLQYEAKLEQAFAEVVDAFLGWLVSRGEGLDGLTEFRPAHVFEELLGEARTVYQYWEIKARDRQSSLPVSPWDVGAYPVPEPARKQMWPGPGAMKMRVYTARQVVEIAWWYYVRRKVRGKNAEEGVVQRTPDGIAVG